MKKTLIVALMMVAGVAQAAVPCIVNPTSPVYHVDTYIRMQSACVTTASAGGSGMSAATAGKVLLAVGILLTVAKIKKDIAIEEKLNIINNDHKVASCSGPNLSIKAVIGKEHTVAYVGNMIEKHTLTDPGVYVRWGFLGPSTLDFNTMEYRGFGKVLMTCKIDQVVEYVNE